MKSFSPIELAACTALAYDATRLFWSVGKGVRQPAWDELSGADKTSFIRSAQYALGGGSSAGVLSIADPTAEPYDEADLPVMIAADLFTDTVVNFGRALERSRS